MNNCTGKRRLRGKALAESTAGTGHYKLGTKARMTVIILSLMGWK